LDGIEYIEYSGTNQQAENPCVVSTKDCKNEAYHYRTDDVDLTACKWLISWEESFRPITSQNLIQPDVNFLRIENEYDNSRTCENQNTGPNGFPPNTQCV